MHRIRLFVVGVALNLFGCNCGFAAHIGAHAEDAAVADAPQDARVAMDTAMLCQRSQDVRFVTRAPTPAEATACALDVAYPTLWFWTQDQCVPYSFQSCSNSLFCEGPDCEDNWFCGDSCLHAYVNFNDCAQAHRPCFQSCGELLRRAGLLCVERCDGTFSVSSDDERYTQCLPDAIRAFNPDNRTQVCECGRCAAQDAREADPNCSDPVPPRFAWNGNDCVRACSCIGNDCEATYETRTACFSAHASCARSACSAMDIQERDSECGGPTRWFFNGSRCKAVNECACMGLDCARAYETESACVAAFATCGACNPFDAHDGPGDCSEAIGGYWWNGQTCTGAACICDGPDCLAGTGEGSRGPYQRIETCMAAHSACGAVHCLGQYAFPSTVLCQAPGNPLYRWNGARCELRDYGCGCRGSDCGALFATEAACIASYQGRCAAPACPAQVGTVTVSDNGGQLTVQWDVRPGWLYMAPGWSAGPSGYRFLANDTRLPGTTNAGLPQYWIPAGPIPGTISQEVRLHAESPCGSWDTIVRPPAPLSTSRYQVPIRVEWH